MTFAPDGDVKGGERPVGSAGPAPGLWAALRIRALRCGDAGWIRIPAGEPTGDRPDRSPPRSGWPVILPTLRDAARRTRDRASPVVGIGFAVLQGE